MSTFQGDTILSINDLAIKCNIDTVAQYIINNKIDIGTSCIRMHEKYYREYIKLFEIDTIDFIKTSTAYGVDKCAMVINNFDEEILYDCKPHEYAVLAQVEEKYKIIELDGDFGAITLPNKNLSFLPDDTEIEHNITISATTEKNKELDCDDISDDENKNRYDNFPVEIEKPYSIGKLKIKEIQYDNIYPTSTTSSVSSSVYSIYIPSSISSSVKSISSVSTNSNIYAAEYEEYLPLYICGIQDEHLIDDVNEEMFNNIFAKYHIDYRNNIDTTIVRKKKKKDVKNKGKNIENTTKNKMQKKEILKPRIISMRRYTDTKEELIEIFTDVVSEIN